jgi:hypothetical protein
LRPGFGAAAPAGLEPALVSPPQYRPANSTVAVDGRDRVAEDESNDAPDTGTAPEAVFTYCITYPLLSSPAALPLEIGGDARAAVHPGAG